MTAPIASRLDHQQCIQAAFDESTGRLRVDAQLSTSILPNPGLEVSILSLYDNIAIRNSGNSHELLINSDGSINVNLETSAIEIGKVDQGAAGIQAWLVDGSGVIQPVSNANLISIDSKFPSGLTVTSTRLLVDGSGVIQPISGTITANIGSSGSLALDSSLSTVNSTLGTLFKAGQSIGNTSFTVTQGTGTNLHTVVDSGSVSVSNFPSVQSIIDQSSTRQQILQAQDTISAFTWADFGTSNQRVTSIAYTSASVLTGHTATKTFAYTLTGGAYRLDSITWSYT